jgi:hypothetical protein
MHPAPAGLPLRTGGPFPARLFATWSIATLKISIKVLAGGKEICRQYGEPCKNNEYASVHPLRGCRSISK